MSVKLVSAAAQEEEHADASKEGGAGLGNRSHRDETWASEVSRVVRS